MEDMYTRRDDKNDVHYFLFATSIDDAVLSQNKDFNG